jgi:hypothetical protein
MCKQYSIDESLTGHMDAYCVFRDTYGEAPALRTEVESKMFSDVSFVTLANISLDEICQSSKQELKNLLRNNTDRFIM